MHYVTYTHPGPLYQLRVPGAVWYDALDPMATDMPAEIGLPTPRSKRVGRGVAFIYDKVRDDQIREVLNYVYDRADVLSRQGDEDEGGVLRRSVKWASDTLERFEKIDAQIKRTTKVTKVSHA